MSPSGGDYNGHQFLEIINVVGFLTMLTSDTMSMLAMSIFIPTPTGGPGTDEKHSKHQKTAGVKPPKGIKLLTFISRKSLK